MPATSAVRVDRVKEAIQSAAATILGAQAEVVWADQGVARPGRPYVALRFATGFQKPSLLADSRLSRAAPTSVSVDLASVSSGVLYRQRINEYPFDVTAGGGDTPTTVRNAHIVLINASSEPVTASNGAGAGETILTPDFPGALRTLSTTPSSSYTVTPSGIAHVIDHIGPRVVVVRASVFVEAGLTELGSQDVGAYALDLAAQLESGFGTESILQHFDNLRVSYIGPAGEPINLTGTAAALNEGRVVLDSRFSVPSLRTETIDVIEVVEVTLDASGKGWTETIDTTP